MMHTVYLLLGANLGDRALTLQRAREAVQVDIGPIMKQSSVYETAAWGILDQPAFLNQVLKVLTVFSPEALLDQTQAIEQRLGRVRRERWGSRLIDIDLLYVDDLVLQTDRLVLPHPFLHQRRFTLIPLAEIEPGLRHPVLDKTTQELLDECQDQGSASRYE